MTEFVLLLLGVFLGAYIGAIVVLGSIAEEEKVENEKNKTYQQKRMA